MTEKHTEQELERIMREGLATRADGAPDSLTGHVPGTQASSGRRHWLAVGGVAAAMIIGVPIVWQAVDDDSRQSEQQPDRVVVDDGATSRWRVESYGGVQVRVPASWGWGGAPMPSGDPGDDRPLDCGTAPFVVPGDGAYETVPPHTPYVGRPVMMTDVCSIVGLENAPDPGPPRADSVWLDAAGVEPGTVDLDDGYVRETVRVGAGTVTVTSDDPTLRARILATAKAVDIDDNGCATRADWSDFPDGRLREVEPESLSVCAYTTFGGETTLLWSTRRTSDQAAAYADAVEATSSTYDPIRLCTERPDGDWLAIGVNGPGEETAWTTVVTGECAQILWHYRAQGDPESLAASPVVPRTVAPWAGSLTRAYLAGPVDWDRYAGGEGEGMFRGYLG